MEINNTRQNVHAGLGESTRCPTTSENMVRQDYKTAQNNINSGQTKGNQGELISSGHF